MPIGCTIIGLPPDRIIGNRICSSFCMCNSISPLHARQQLGQPLGHGGMLGVHFLDALRERAQLRQLLAVHLMIAVDDELDQPVDVIRQGIRRRR